MSNGSQAAARSGVLLFPQPALRLIYDTAPIGLVLMSLRPELRKRSLALDVACEGDMIMDSLPGPYGLVLSRARSGTSLKRCRPANPTQGDPL